jgi:DNA-binding CsgD family transcriptional regulator
MVESLLISRLAKCTLCVQLTKGSTGAPEGEAAFLFLTELDSNLPRTFDRIVQQLYGLTPAEARLAAELVRGRDVRTAAANLHITFHTARDHLKRIFGKVGVRRQSELARLLLSSAQVDPPFEG